MSDRIDGVAILILAAGESKRMGQPKQLLDWQGKPLLQWIIDKAKTTRATPILLMLGAIAEEIRKHIDSTALTILNNPDWQEGIASSIRMGVEHLEKHHPHIHAVLIMVCDQPFIPPHFLAELVNHQHNTNFPAVASEYNGTLGTPVVFHRRFFARLKELSGDQGARKLLKQFPEEIGSITLDQGYEDLDTPEDYAFWLAKNERI